MNKNWSRKSLKNAQAAVWLIGLGVLFLLDAFWPGILILVGISIIFNSLMPEEEEADETPSFDDEVKAPVEEVVEEEVFDEGLPDPIPPMDDGPLQVFAGDLPKECPACGGPIAENALAVKPAGPGKVMCPFCDTVIAVE